MTAQRGDIYKHNGKEYTLIALSSSLPFDPKNYALEPHTRSTACYRGYWCTYAIEDEILHLEELYIFNRDGNYPTLNGVDISEEEYTEALVIRNRVKRTELIPKYAGHRVYKNINLPVSYTGKMLLGKDFIRDYYIHLGFQRYWAYKHLIELVFEDGILVETNDYSDVAKQQRELLKQLESNPNFLDNCDTSSFIKDAYFTKPKLFDYVY